MSNKSKKVSQPSKLKNQAHAAIAARIKAAKQLHEAGVKKKQKESQERRAKTAKRKLALKQPPLNKATKLNEAGLKVILAGNGFEGVKRIDHLPLEKQIDTVFNPLHTVTNTTLAENVSEATFIVEASEPIVEAEPKSKSKSKTKNS